MDKKSQYDGDFDFSDNDRDYSRSNRKFKKVEPVKEKKRSWDRETLYDKGREHDDRR
jgi:hypothetical protein